MGNFEFIKTRDGSLGLFNNGINDIYHAREGAYSEAINKFAKPACSYLTENKLHDTLNVCDICYGIGYNTAAIIQEICKNNIIKNFNKIEITALEYDKTLIILSPFLKYTQFNIAIKLKILSFIKKQFTKNEINSVLVKIDKGFTDRAILNRFKGKLLLTPHISEPRHKKRLFLHNTYYNYISDRQKKTVNLSNINKFYITYHFKDARKTIFETPNNQNIVFLDAFDPKKLPTLWTKEFFDAIFSKMNTNGILFTYSHAASIRSAMLEAGFFIGNNNFQGTVAAKTKENIRQALSDYEKGLLNTNAGISYRDYNLTMSAKEILKERMEKINTQNRESSTHYAKTHQK